MFGNEDETVHSLINNLIWIINNKPEALGIGITIPYPGTPLCRMLQNKFGIKTLDDWYQCYELFKKMHPDPIAKRLLNAAFVQAFHKNIMYGSKTILGLVNLLYFLKYPIDYIKLRRELRFIKFMRARILQPNHDKNPQIKLKKPEDQNTQNYLKKTFSEEISKN